MTDIEWKKWTFPRNIKYDEVPVYLQQFHDEMYDRKLIIDLTNTHKIHSSFIGFLLHVKDHVEKNNKSMALLISYTVEKIFSILEISDHFSTEIITDSNRKSA